MTDRKKAIEVLRLSEPMQKTHSLMETAICIAKRESYLTDEEEATLREAVDVGIQALKQEPCEDAISRSDAIRVASGYCHWSNIPKELAKLPSVNPIQCEDVISRQAIIDSLHSKFVDGFDSDRWWNSMSVLYAINKVPSVSTKNPNRCGDTISRQAVLKGLASIAKAKAKSDAQKSMMGRTMFFVEQLPSVSTEKTGWIPVSERLPETEEFVLASLTGKYRNTTFEHACEIADYADGGWCVYAYPHMSAEKCEELIEAWMPLPQPYTGESEE